MDQEILAKVSSQAVQQFIRENENSDTAALLLRTKTVHGIPSSIIVDQIRGRQKARYKIPTFYRGDVFFPPGISLEQSSSEQTAQFKVSILQTLNLPHTNAVDLTGGFGVDSFFLSRYFTDLDYVEPNETLNTIVQFNHEKLGANNIHHHRATAEQFLESGTRADLFYIDPSRREESKKVFAFADGHPNVVALMPAIFKHSQWLLIKASPLLDIKHSLEELRNVKRVYVVAVDNEVKELLLLCHNGFDQSPLIESVNLKGDESTSFVFTINEEDSADPKFSDPKEYLYEPFSSVLKGGAFRIVGQRFNLFKLQPSTHLYTADHLDLNFPGRIFRILKQVKPEKNSVQSSFPEGKANVTTRNYPLSVDELKKRTGLKDGGDKFLIGFSGRSQKYLVVAERLK